ncbi:MAG: hypothetical protein QE271_00680 [Bacteriovoracaceae bacterium]|nr:hypothetical protein [Bacteriovoracaceae bacterium]
MKKILFLTFAVVAILLNTISQGRSSSSNAVMIDSNNVSDSNKNISVYPIAVPGPIPQ